MSAKTAKQNTAAVISFKEMKQKAGSRSKAWGASRQSARGLLTLIRSIKQGFPISHFEQLKNCLEISEKDLAVVVNISPRTLARRKKDGRFQSDESERVLRIARLFDRAVEVLGSAEEAKNWFKVPNPGLGEAAPLFFADTEPGAREVEDLLGRLEWGLFT